MVGDDQAVSLKFFYMLDAGSSHPKGMQLGKEDGYKIRKTKAG